MTMTTPGHTCDRCARNYRVEWAVTKELWDRVRGAHDFLCLECFGVMARDAGAMLTGTDLRFLSVGGSILVDAMPGEPALRDGCGAPTMNTAPRDLVHARGLVEYVLSASCRIDDAITREHVAEVRVLLNSLIARCAAPEQDRAAIESLCAAGKERAA